MLNITKYKKDLLHRAENFELTEAINHLINTKLEDLNDTQNTKEFFVRLSSTSGKNEKGVKPFRTGKEIVEHLQDNSIFAQREYLLDKDTYLILIPWDYHFDRRNEFRIFVVDGKITCASQQWWSELFNYEMEELETIQEILNTADFSSFPYKTFVANIYFNLTERTFFVIELNPFGAFCGAGSSLFNWIDDFDVIYGYKQGEMRYLSVINF